MSGHVFVVRGDLRALACDAWLLPTDRALYVSESWASGLSGPVPGPPEGWSDQRRRAFPADHAQDRPVPWLVNVGGPPGTPVEWYMDGVRQFLDAAASSLHGRTPLHDRAVPLFGLPLVGTGEGGAGEVAGQLAATLLDVLWAAARRLGIDIVLVTASAPAFAAVQARRRTAGNAGFEVLGALGDRARELGEEAARGRLVVFLGAGTSAGAGIPVWARLLDELATECGFSDDERASLGRLNALDRARILERRLAGSGVSLDDRVVARASADHVSLSHALLAGLPVAEFATTNFDSLFERAAAAAGRPAAVLPYEPVMGRSRWLLKMHGSVDHPDDIVLTREDYLRYSERRAALAGIVQALLVTRHMLFTGFSLQDENFHRLVHDVRNAIGHPGPGDARVFGTALVLHPEPFITELWAADLEIVTLDEARRDESTRYGARRLEIFLDRMLLAATSSVEHLLDGAFEAILTPAERALRDALCTMKAQVPEEARQGAAWERVARFLRKLGDSGSQPTRSP